MKTLIKIILSLFAFIIVVNIYLWLPFYLEQDKKAWRKLSEVYGDVWINYEIWKHYWVNKICNKDKKVGCLNSELKGLKFIDDNNIYLYFYLYRSVTNWSYKNEPSHILGYGYDLFLNSKNFFVQDEWDIPEFWYIYWGKIIFYSGKDLKKLPMEQQNIFKELEKNPTIVIDWVDYIK